MFLNSRAISPRRCAALQCLADVPDRRGKPVGNIPMETQLKVMRDGDGKLDFSTSLGKQY